MLKIGIQGRSELLIGVELLATSFKSGLADVYATPAMIALMEETSMESVIPYLDKDSITVGTEVNIRHLKAVGEGTRVVCQTELIEIKGLELVFDVKVVTDEFVVGEGTHTRFIVDKERFTKKMKKNI